MNHDYMPSVMKSNSQLKREAAEYHNHLVEQHGHQSVAGRVVETAGVSQRHALAAARDATSGTQNRTRGGRRMRSRAAVRIDSVMRGRNKIRCLFARAGINLDL